MALIIKKGQTYIDKSEVIHSEGYFRVVNFTYQRDIKLMDFYLLGYSSESARQKNLPPFDVIRFTVTQNDFDKWFCYEVIEKNTNLETQAYNYIMQLTDDDGNLIYGDIFQSDIAPN